MHKVKQVDSHLNPPPKSGRKEKSSLPHFGGKVRMGGLDRARELRKNPTDAERKLWLYLRLRQVGGNKFRRQRPVDKYIVDFVCLEKKLVIELDGGQHSGRVDYDTERSKWLESQGYRVLRFWNNEVLKNIEIVMDVILRELTRGNKDTPTFNPPPYMGRKYDLGGRK